MQPVLAGGARGDETFAKQPGRDEVDALGPYEAVLLKSRRDAVLRVLAQREQWRELLAMLHPEQRTLSRRARSRGERAPLQEPGDFFERARRQIGSIFGRRQCAWRRTHELEALQRLRDPAFEDRAVPVEAGVAVLYRLVPGQVD